jgi:hypothetical protein
LPSDGRFDIQDGRCGAHTNCPCACLKAGVLAELWWKGKALCPTGSFFALLSPALAAFGIHTLARSRSCQPLAVASSRPPLLVSLVAGVQSRTQPFPPLHLAAAGHATPPSNSACTFLAGRWMGGDSGTHSRDCAFVLLGHDTWPGTCMAVLPASLCFRNRLWHHILRRQTRSMAPRPAATTARATPGCKSRSAAVHRCTVCLPA